MFSIFYILICGMKLSHIDWDLGHRKYHIETHTIPQFTVLQPQLDVHRGTYDHMVYWLPITIDISISFLIADLSFTKIYTPFFNNKNLQSTYTILIIPIHIFSNTRLSLQCTLRTEVGPTVFNANKCV